MDLLMIVLRFIHICAGIFWVGSASFMLFVVIPAAMKTGPNGAAFMRGLMIYTPFNTAMLIAALLTTVAGLILYHEVSDGFNADWMKSASGIVLSIGSLAGLSAFGHGASTLGPTNAKLAKLSAEIEAQGGTPTTEQLATFAALGVKNKRNATISFVMMVIAVAGMSSARYM